MSDPGSDPARYGLIGAFATPLGAVTAARRLREAGFARLDAYTPFPVEELAEAVPIGHGVMLPLLVVAGALFGAIAGYFVQYWAAVVDYPVNIGGRPYDSWPAFTVSAFEVTLLFAIAAGFLAFLIAARLPLLYHPVFAAADFARASQDRFLLCVEARDPHFDAAHIRRILEEAGAERIDEVPG